MAPAKSVIVIFLANTPPSVKPYLSDEVNNVMKALLLIVVSRHFANNIGSNGWPPFSFQMAAGILNASFREFLGKGIRPSILRV